MSIHHLEDTVSRIAKNYENELIFFTDSNKHIPSRSETISILNDLKTLMFPGYFGGESLTGTRLEYFIGEKLIHVNRSLQRQVYAALHFRDGNVQSPEQIQIATDEICDRFLAKIPDLQDALFKDTQAAFDGDPAAQSKEEIIFAYPGLFAIFVYRIAHELYVEDVPLLPRIMTEYAHSSTGVDINAGATIGEYFFIDHATGVVIGETTLIGDHVKIYQGVTLGALSTRAGQKLAGKKRHPTIEDYVTIYSNASVLGGETVIGKGAIIGGSAFVTHSIPCGARVGVKNQEINVRVPEGAKSWCYEDGALEAQAAQSIQ